MELLYPTDWGQIKPSAEVPLDLSHPLLLCAEHYYAFNEGGGATHVRDLIKNNPISFSGTTLPKWVSYTGGRAVSNSGTTTGRLDPARPFEASSRWSILLGVAIHGPGDSFFGRVFTNAINDNTRFLTDGAINTVSMNVNGTGIFSGVDLSIIQHRLHWILFSADGTNLRTYVDGILKRTDTHVDFPATNVIYLGNRTGNDRAADATYDRFVYWKRALSQGEAMELAVNPNGHFMPSWDVVFTDTGGGGGATSRLLSLRRKAALAA